MSGKTMEQIVKEKEEIIAKATTTPKKEPMPVGDYQINRLLEQGDDADEYMEQMVRMNAAPATPQGTNYNPNRPGSKTLMPWETYNQNPDMTPGPMHNYPGTGWAIPPAPPVNVTVNNAPAPEVGRLTGQDSLLAPLDPKGYQPRKTIADTEAGKAVSEFIDREISGPPSDQRGFTQTMITDPLKQSGVLEAAEKKIDDLNWAGYEALGEFQRRDIQGPPKDQAGFFETMIGRPLSQAHKSWVRERQRERAEDRTRDHKERFPSAPQTAKEAMEIATSDFDMSMMPEEEYGMSIRREREPETGMSREPETGMSMEREYGMSMEREPEDGMSMEVETGISMEREADDGGMSIEEDAYKKQYPSKKPASRSAGFKRNRGQAMSGDETKKTIAVAIQEMATSPDAKPWHVSLQEQMIKNNPMFASLIPSLIQKSVLKHQRAILADNKKKGIAGDKAYSNYLNSMMRHAQAKELTNLRNLPQLKRLSQLKAKDAARELKKGTMSISEIGDYLIQRDGRVSKGVELLMNAKTRVGGTFGDALNGYIKGFSNATSDDSTLKDEGFAALGLEEGVSHSPKKISEAFSKKKKELADMAIRTVYNNYKDLEDPNRLEVPTYNIIAADLDDALLESLYNAAAEDENVLRAIEAKGGPHHLVDSLTGTNWQIQPQQVGERREKILSKKSKNKRKY